MGKGVITTATAKPVKASPEKAIAVGLLPVHATNLTGFAWEPGATPSIGTSSRDSG